MLRMKDVDQWFSYVIHVRHTSQVVAQSCSKSGREDKHKIMLGSIGCRCTVSVRVLVSGIVGWVCMMCVEERYITSAPNVFRDCISFWGKSRINTISYTISIIEATCRQSQHAGL